jgi:glutamine synthetase type III
MNYLRKKSLEKLFGKQPRSFENDQKYSSLFASHVFTDAVLEQYVNKETYNRMKISPRKYFRSSWY